MFAPQSLAVAPATLPALSLAAMKLGAKQLLKTSVSIGGKAIALTYTVATTSKAICSISGSTLTAKKKGACSVVATAPALAGYTHAFKQTLVVRVS